MIQNKHERRTLKDEPNAGSIHASIRRPPSAVRRPASRRGVTLVEMLVTVAVLVIIMTILVQIFQAATGALTTAQTIQELDNQLKLLDSTIRADLGGVTARFTPPLDPAQGLGYFEYGENEFADSQGEDSDDTLRFTAKAPPGQPFTGRIWVSSGGALPMNNSNVLPVTVTSEYAEIIYFLRNGNLYRRVLLVAPELQSAIVPTINNAGFFAGNGTGAAFTPLALGGTIPVSWQGMNDISARPAAIGPNFNAVTVGSLAQAQQTIVLNTLGDLTNRENRFASPRFANDFFNFQAGTHTADGFWDDLNNDKVPDYYPSLYFNLTLPTQNGGPTNQLIFEPNFPNVPRPGASFATMAFPYIFPGAYSNPQHLTNDQFGWIHAPAPYAVVPQPPLGSGLYAPVPFQGNGNGTTLQYLNNINHNPLDLGDNLPNPNLTIGPGGARLTQTWWGFPTWRETLSPNWNDPTVQVNVAFAQPNGLAPRVASAPVNDDPNLLPPLAQPPTFNGLFSVFRRTSQLFCDTWGETSLFWGGANASEAPLWSVSWEDDLIMTNVRSFDVKAYDNAFAGYADLGWGDDLRLYVPYSTNPAYLYTGLNALTGPPALAGTPPLLQWPPLSTTGLVYGTLATFAHEGRMPPMVADLRFDAHYGAATYPGFAYTGNVGDDTSGVVRLRRVWETWSLEYTQAPWQGLNVNTNFLVGPATGSPPIYPSYPPPYPAPLRGIQIQIRVADPTNQRIKSLTIRQDFTDKL